MSTFLEYVEMMDRLQKKVSVYEKLKEYLESGAADDDVGVEIIRDVLVDLDALAVAPLQRKISIIQKAKVVRNVSKVAAKKKPAKTPSKEGKAQRAKKPKRRSAAS